MQICRHVLHRRGGLAGARRHIRFTAPVRIPLPQIQIYLHIDTEPRYTSALQSLSHVLVLTPQNPFYVLQAGETAYTAQDIPLAMRFFLMVIEMTGDDDDVVSLLTCTTPPQAYETKPLSLLLVGSTSRGGTDAGNFLAVENTRARTPVKTAEAGAGSDRLSPSWPARRRSKSIIELANRRG